MKNYQCLFSPLVACLFRTQHVLNAGIVEAIINNKHVDFVRENDLESNPRAIISIVLLLDIFNEMGKLRPAGWIIDECILKIMKDFNVYVNPIQDKLWLGFLKSFREKKKNIREGKYVVTQISSTPIGTAIFLRAEGSEEIVIRDSKLGHSLKVGDYLLKVRKKSLRKL